MDVRIGITHSMREVELELADDVSPEALKTEVEAVLADDERTLWLTDKRGREVGVPGKRISFVEIGSGNESRNIGFSV